MSPTIPEELEARAQDGAGRLVFHLADGPVDLGVAELAQRAGAGALADRGIGQGDRVGLLSPNRPEWAVWAHAVFLGGAALVPLLIPLRVRDAAALTARVGAVVDAAGCDLVVADPALAFAVQDVAVHGWDAPLPAGGTPPPQCCRTPPSSPKSAGSAIGGCSRARPSSARRRSSMT